MTACALSLDGYTGGAAGGDEGGMVEASVLEASVEAAADTSPPTDAADASVAPSLAVDLALPGSTHTFDLTTLGSLDWLKANDTVTRCAGCAARFGTPDTTADNVFSYSDDPRTFVWSNGQPTATGSDSDGIYIEGVGNEFTIPVRVSSARSVLTLYVDTYYSAARLTASITGTSLTKMVMVPPLGDTNLYSIAIHFAGTEGSMLNVAWTMITDVLAGTDSGGNRGNVAIIAATLAPDP